MNRWAALYSFHRFMRRLQAAYRRKHGKEPTTLPWEGDEKKMKNIIAWILKLKFMQQYRRVIGIAAMIGGGVIELLSRQDMMNALPWLADYSGQIMAIGAFVAIIGSAYKDDPIVPISKIAVGVPDTVVVTKPAPLP